MREPLYHIPLTVHSDTIARLQITLAIEYQIGASVMPQGLNEVLLPYDFGSLPKAQGNVLQLAAPPNMRIAPNGVTAQVRGAFEASRIVHGPTGAVTPAGTVEISPQMSQAQMISLPETLKAAAFDLFMAVTQAAKLQLDLREDLDGKPGGVSLLPGPVKFGLPAPVGTAQDRKTGGELRWVSIVLPAEFQFQKDSKEEPQRYWLVLQCLEGQTAWNATPAAAGMVGMQHTKDGGLSWRDTTAAGISGSVSAFFRLRQKPARFETPIELEVGSGEQAIRVSLDRFQPLGRVDFALDFDEVAQAFNRYLDKTSPVSCPEVEHLANRDFEQWLRVGDKLMPLVPIDLGASPKAGAVAPDGLRAYVAGDKNESGFLQIIDVVCNKTIGDLLRMQSISAANALAISPDGTRAYVGDSLRLQVVDTSIPAALGVPLELRGGVNALALSPDGGRLYATEYFFNSTVQRGAVRALDTVKTEHAVVQGDPKLEDLTIGQIDLGPGLEPMASAVSPDGRHLYVAISKGTDANGLVQVFDTATLEDTATPKPLASPDVGQEPSAIALTPDGKWAVVANAGSNSISIIDTARGVVVGSDIPLGGSPKALGISPEGSRAYVAIVAQNGSASQNADIVLSVIDLTRRAVVNTMTVFEQVLVGTSPVSVALALTPQGDKIYVAHEESGSIASVQIGERLPAEWNLTAGQVTPFCLPDPFHLVAVLGGRFQLGQVAAIPSPSALSQTVAVAESCPYEFSFDGIATDTDALAEVLWIGQDCGLLRKDQIPIQALERSMLEERILTHVSAVAIQQPRLKPHRARLVAPVGSEQAEVRFSTPVDVQATIDLVSLTATTEAVANADLSLRQQGQLTGWNLLSAPVSGVTVVAVEDGIQLRSAGAETAELVQAIPVKGDQPFNLEFQGRAIVRPLAKDNPGVELRWFKADQSLAGSPVILEVAPTDFDSALASGISPTGASEAELHLMVPPGTTLEIKRVSLRFSTATSVPVTFMAQAPGELTVSNWRVSLEQAEVSAPLIPDTGLCTPTPPGRQPGETPSDCCFCPCCETERTMTEITPMKTRAERPVSVGRCSTCGTDLVLFGGKRVPGAQPFSLGRREVSRPIVLHPIAARVVMPTKERLKAEVPATAPLTSIDGIGEARARRLAESGIDSIEKLAAAAPEDVAKALEAVSVGKAAGFIERAKLLLASAKKP